MHLYKLVWDSPYNKKRENNKTHFEHAGWFSLKHAMINTEKIYRLKILILTVDVVDILYSSNSSGPVVTSYIITYNVSRFCQ